MGTPEHIVHIPRRFVIGEWGGSETFLAEICPRLQHLGFSNRIFTTTALDATPGDSFRGIPVKRFPYFYPYAGLTAEAKLAMDKKAGNLFSFGLMHALAKDQDVDLIHLHTGKRLGGIGRYCAKKKGIPYVISLHGGNLAVPDDERGTWTEPTKGAFEWGKVLGMWVGSRDVLTDAAAIICVGKEEHEAMVRQYPGKLVEYLPNGVDLQRFSHAQGSAFRLQHGIPSDRIVYLVVARLDVQKNQLGLVKQLPAVLAEIPEAHLVFIGHVTNPGYRDEVLAEATTQGVSDRLTLIPGIPYQDHMLVDAYASADCFVLPSLHEPFGMVVLEAWASSLPVAVSQRGGLASLVTPETDGLFFDPEADVGSDRSIASVLVRLGRDPRLRASLGDAGLQTATRSYSWDSIASKLADIYRRIG